MTLYTDIGKTTYMNLAAQVSATEKILPALETELHWSL